MVSLRFAGSAYLEVDVLQPAHDDAIERLLGHAQGAVVLLLELLDVYQRANKRSVQGALVGQAVDVLGRMRVDVLERTGQLVVEPLDERNDAARDLEDLALGDGGLLVIVFPLLGTLDHDNLLGALERLQELVELLLCAGICQSLFG